MTTQSEVVARVAMTHQDGSKTIIEVYIDADLQGFYRWYRREKGKRDKHFMRSSHRGDAANLQVLAERQKQQSERLASSNPKIWGGRKIINIKVAVMKIRKYKYFLNCSPDQLPGYCPPAPRSVDLLAPGIIPRFGANKTGLRGIATSRDISGFCARQRGTFRR